MASKVGSKTASGNRDSNPQYLGVKKSGGQFARAGNILIRQKGARVKSGIGTYYGRDFTIHAFYDGRVTFSGKKIKYVSIKPINNDINPTVKNSQEEK
jgi:large subunit ribosomal protein L27